MELPCIGVKVHGTQGRSFPRGGVSPDPECGSGPTLRKPSPHRAVAGDVDTSGYVGDHSRLGYFVCRAWGKSADAIPMICSSWLRHLSARRTMVNRAPGESQ